jgi:hypothetical protein
MTTNADNAYGPGPATEPLALTLNEGLGPERAEFAQLIEQFTGRPIEYHIRAKTTGIDLAWVAFVEGRKKVVHVASDSDIDALSADDFPSCAAPKPLSERLRSAAARCTRYNADVALLCEYAETAADRLKDQERNTALTVALRDQFFGA